MQPLSAQSLVAIYIVLHRYYSAIVSVAPVVMYQIKDLREHSHIAKIEPEL